MCPLPAVDDTPCFPTGDSASPGRGRSFYLFHSLLNPWCSKQCGAGTDRALSSGLLNQSASWAQALRVSQHCPPCPACSRLVAAPAGRPCPAVALSGRPRSRSWAHPPGAGLGGVWRPLLVAQAHSRPSRHLGRGPRTWGTQPVPSPNFLPPSVEARGPHRCQDAPVWTFCRGSSYLAGSVSAPPLLGKKIHPCRGPFWKGPQTCLRACPC